MMTPKQKAARRLEIMRQNKATMKSRKISSVQRLRWAEKRAEEARRQALDGGEVKDTTIESAGNPDYDIMELPDLVLG